MNGWELAERVRQQSLAAEVVLATGWGADIDPDTARNRGVVAVLAKPYRVAEIRRITADIARSIAHRASELDQASPPGSLTDV